MKQLDHRIYHRRTHDWEPYDEIRISIKPRYKTSGLSGDEWRTTTIIEFLYKGKVVQTKTASSVESAVMMLCYHFKIQQTLKKAL